MSNLDDTRTIGRTSSTDTYSVAQSSESPTSSGLSSPMEAQSYDDIQSTKNMFYFEICGILYAAK